MTDTPDLPFSWRFGFRALPNDSERREFTERLRLELWAALRSSFIDPFVKHRAFLVSRGVNADTQRTLVMELLTRGCQVHLEPGFDYERLWTGIMNVWWKAAAWHDLADVIELICELAPRFRDDIQAAINSAFSRSLSIWRITNGRLVPVANAEGLRAIDDALSDSPWPTAIDHLRKAITYLGDRRSPDPENSIKESISAVESAVQIIIKDGKATLGAALPRLQESLPQIHAALIKSWTALYGYASDAPGVRHAAKPNSAPRTESEARFAVVTCSAILNFLKDAVQHAQ